MKYCLFALTLIVATSIAASTAFAGSISAPSGLNPGDQFRIVFVTDGTIRGNNEVSSTYDSLVQSEAAGTTYNGNSVTWLAIISSSNFANPVSAISHIGENTTSSIPVYLVDGTKVASSDNSNGLWSGALQHSINEDIGGQTNLAFSVWTGTSSSGTIATPTNSHFGIRPTYGSTVSSDANWINAGTSSNTTSYHVYGISEVLTVPQSTAAVPEPSTAMLAGLGGLVALAYSLKRKRN